MNLLTRVTWLALLLPTLLLSACDKKKKPDDPKPADGRLDVKVEHLVGTQPLALTTGTYTNAHGEAFRVSRFNYFISNLRLTQADGTEWREPESYRIVKESDPGSKSFTVAGIPPGEYTKLTFTLGVDSVRNYAGAQTGALDVLNGMYWTWETGYVFFKLEGQSVPGNTPFEYHAGGARHPFNTARVVSPALGARRLVVGAGKASTVLLQADVQQVFSGKAPFPISQYRNVHSGADAMKLADNYQTMLRVADVQN
ncbi:MbnP family protein [Hymenobacter sp. B81]|uniref:MbnP family protein n=1 Tax=Hymenobacter sp. B81 TaxID=3344878 RepID=UPI0037DDE220